MVLMSSLYHVNFFKVLLNLPYISVVKKKFTLHFLIFLKLGTIVKVNLSVYCNNSKKCSQ